jgi:hypothetical protein
MTNRWKQPDYVPTPNEIEQKCEEIQRSWSDRERRRRMLFVWTDSKCAVANELEYAETELHDPVPYHPELLTSATEGNNAVDCIARVPING